MTQLRFIELLFVFVEAVFVAPNVSLFRLLQSQHVPIRDLVVTVATMALHPQQVSSL